MNRRNQPIEPLHIIVWNERSLHRHLQHYLANYHEWRTHLSLDKDAIGGSSPCRRSFS